MMMTTDASILLQACSSLIFVAFGALLLFWGRRLPRSGEWAVAIAAVFALAVSILNWVELSGSGFQPLALIRGWIWKRAESGAIDAGVIRDGVSVVGSFLVAVVTAVILLARERFVQETRADRLYAGIALAAGGATLAWIAATPWTALVGIAVASIGGGLCYGSRWESETESAIATQYAWNRGWALALSVLGTMLMASGQAPLAWGSALQPGHLTLMGGALVTGGLLMCFDTFPLMGFLRFAPETASSVEILAARLFPAAASFALLYRLEPQLRALEVFPLFGWVAGAVALLSILQGFLGDSQRVALYGWISGGFALSVATLAQAGTRAGFAAFVGVFLGSAVLAIAGGELETSASNSNSNRNRAVWTKVAAFLGAATAAGLPGFIFAREGVNWFALSLAGESPANVVLPSALVLFGGLLAWRIFWLEKSSRNYSVANWRVIAACVCLSLLGLAIFWTGSATGSLVEGVSDRVMGSVLDSLFVIPVNSPGEAMMATALPLYGGVTVLAFLLSFWLGAKEDRWARVPRAFPRFSQFVSKGFGADPVGIWGRRAAVAVSQGLARWLDEKTWSGWLPAGFRESIRWPARQVSRLDDRGGEKVLLVLRPTTEASAKFLQLIQNGDVQWYLVFALGCGVAILLHFLRVA